MSIPIGTDFRLSIADFAGEFHELEPWQRDLVEKIAAIPPEERDRVLVIEGSGTAPILAQLGRDGGSIIIDDPWADGEPLDLEAHRAKFERAAALMGEDAVVVMSRVHDMHALDNARYPGPLRAKELRSALPPAGPGNRAERRAEQARRRKGRR